MPRQVSYACSIYPNASQVGSWGCPFGSGCEAKWIVLLQADGLREDLMSAEPCPSVRKSAWPVLEASTLQNSFICNNVPYQG